jgi:hypothetical protein
VQYVYVVHYRDWKDYDNSHVAFAFKRKEDAEGYLERIQDDPSIYEPVKVATVSEVPLF